jgi:hypothetical protein
MPPLETTIVQEPPAKRAAGETANRLSRWTNKLSAPLPRLRINDEGATRTRLAVLASLVFLVAFGVRLLHWQDIDAEHLYGETMITKLVDHYALESRLMLEERGLLFPGVPVDPGDAHRIMHPPGYSILLLAIYGEGAPDRFYGALRLIQIIGDAIASVVIVAMCAKLFPLAIAGIAGFLVAFSPHLSYYSLWLTPDSLAALPILIALYLFIKATQRPRLLTMALAGALLGLSCWLRSNSLLLAPMLALLIPFLFVRGKRWRYASALIGTALLVIAPITIRNWLVYQRFIPLTIATGVNLVQGIAEYDKEDKFGMPVGDAEVLQKDVEWHGRPDYGADTWKPDGVGRDEARFARGLEVARSNPGWFLGMMVKRMGFMVRFNDFGPTTRPFYTTVAPAVMAAPIFAHRADTTDSTRPVYSIPAEQLQATGSLLSERATISPCTEGEAIEIGGDDSELDDQFSSTLLTVRKNTDYVLATPMVLVSGRVAAKIKAEDPRITLASLALPRGRKAKKTKKRSAGSHVEQPAGPILIPFASGSFTQVRLVLSNDGKSPEPGVVRVGEARLYEMGPTPHSWTSYPRSVVRGIQKNVFKTELMRPLIVIGIALLVLVRRRRALLVILVVPIYYLTTHSAFSTEVRYILAMHYFLFIIAAVALYGLSSVIAGYAAAILARVRLRRGFHEGAA